MARFWWGRVMAATRHPTNSSKVSQIVQGHTEFPDALLEWLLDTYRTYILTDLEVTENLETINMIFVAQSSPDI